MPLLNLVQLAVGDRVQHELRVVDRVERSKPGGEPFVILTLGNASGQIDTEPIWSNLLADGWADGVDRGAIVQVIGDVGRYVAKGQAKRQIRLTAPLRLIPHDSVDIEDFLPRIDEPTAKYWDYIDRTRREMRSETLRRVLGLFFDDDEFRQRFERTPGSISRHHAKLGGLLLHVSEVTAIARTAAKTSRANIDLVTVGALLHDVGKVESYEIAATGFAYTPCGHLLGHVVLGCLMLERRLAALGMPLCTDIQALELQHMILSHHGSLEFGSPVEPKTLEAEIVHWADEASAKVADFGDALTDRDGFPDGDEFSRRLWKVGRSIWRPSHRWE